MNYQRHQRYEFGSERAPSVSSNSLSNQINEFQTRTSKKKSVFSEGGLISPAKIHEIDNFFDYHQKELSVKALKDKIKKLKQEVNGINKKENELLDKKLSISKQITNYLFKKSQMQNQMAQCNYLLVIQSFRQSIHDIDKIISILEQEQKKQGLWVDEQKQLASKLEREIKEIRDTIQRRENKERFMEKQSIKIDTKTDH